jgi:hypothetical protein
MEAYREGEGGGMNPMLYKNPNNKMVLESPRRRKYNLL